MDAVERAFEVYHSVLEPPGVSWEDAVQAHWQGGVVICCPQLFCLCRLVCKGWSDERLLDCYSVAVPEDADSWMIWVASGDLSFLNPVALATPMKWVAFQHHSYRIKFVPWVKVLKLHQLHQRHHLFQR